MLKPVLTFILILFFRNSIFAQQTVADTTNNNDDKIFAAVEMQPEFPGGMAAFYKFLGNNIRYPATAREKNVQGRVFVTFIVEKDGTLTGLKILRAIGSGCDEEVIRVLQKSPKWHPGTQNGKPVRVQYSVPIAFNLQDNYLTDGKSMEVVEFVGLNQSKKDVDVKTDTLVAYFKFPNKMISPNNKEAADYIMFIYPPADVKNGSYNVKEIYKNGQVKFVSQLYNKPLPIAYQGRGLYFYETGKKQAIVNFEKGLTSGSQYFYYPNGILYCERSIEKNGTTRFVTCRDSSGKILSENGNGEWLIYDGKFSRVVSSGTVKNGKFDGEWISYPNADIMLSEVYKNGLVTKTRKFNKIDSVFIAEDEMPMYKGNFNELVKYLIRNIKYPKAAAKNKVSGQVKVEVNVDPNGTLTDVNIISGLGYGCDEEAVRLFKASGPWKPNSQLKQSIKYSFSIPFGPRQFPGDISRPGFNSRNVITVYPSTRNDGMPLFYN